MNGMLNKVQDLIAAPTCCEELKSAAQAYLSAINTDGERIAADALIASLKENVNTIDDVIAFVQSADGKAYFGEETAKQLLERGLKVKAEGGKYCFCPACTVGADILANRDKL